MGENEKNAKMSVLTSSQAYFNQVVHEALEKRRIDTSPYVSKYLVNLLETNIVSENMIMKTTLAEALLMATQSGRSVRIELLRKLGDTSLYVSGFFGDSLRRKIIDIDYYADIGGAAYASLASEIEETTQANVFNEISNRFLDYVDLLTYISQTTLVQSNQDLLRLYERYIITGSELAKDQLIEKGLLVNEQMKKTSNQ